jgi:hypothetical protein
MGISTCSGAISLSRELENESAKFYQELSKRFEKDKDLFLAFAKENAKYVTQIERAYYGVITDAIEGCFAFDLNPEDFQIKAAPSKDASYSNALKEALAILRSCSRAVETSDGRCSEKFHAGRQKEKRAYPEVKGPS